jgi:hypothetical protein
VGKHSAARLPEPKRAVAMVLVLAGVILGSVFSVVWVTSEGFSNAHTDDAVPASLSAAPLVDPITTLRARLYLDQLDAHNVPLEPHKALEVGEQVCVARQDRSTDLSALAVQLRGVTPGLTAAQVTTLVRVANRTLCSN